MVLARKKLKQKLHTLVPSGDAEAAEHEAEAQAVKERLTSSKRPRPRRPKKSKKSLPEEVWQTEEEWRKEVERRREERRNKKKEKRRIRRLTEAEAAAAATQQSGGEAEAKEETVEVTDPAVGSEHPVEAEDREQTIKNVEVPEPRVRSNNPVVADNREQNHKVEVAKSGAGSNNPVFTENREQSIKKVYVGGIPYYSSEDDIRSFFEGCGSITAIDCMTFPESGKFRGIAILTFKTDAAAQRALALDSADMGGFYLKIQPYKYYREKEDFAPKLIEGYNRIYVGNLPWDITEDDIKKFFSDCKISSIRFGRDKETSDFKGYVHVDFSDGTSLAVALKLDQKVIKGRPVRIRCAVPKKDNQKVNDNGNSDPSKNKIRACYECGTPGHLSSSCPNKKDSEVRTCYECGSPGHLSSSCPNKKDSEVRICYECGTPGHLSSSCPNKKGSEVISDETKANVDSATASSKKRRTCYECGTPGHLSSACPNKRAADSVLNNMELDDDAKAAPTLVSEEKKLGDESNSAPSKKRRKCYECGISGHLSSACPNKKAAEVVCNEEKPDDGSNAIPSAIADEKKASDDTKSVPPKKKKRRTCYECGIAGHLSSECPNKAAAEVK
ncbi:phragmoplastin interacting protein 1-like [Phragmites australis]|uniref:phragmoplastin interacting protein 1-like n=1 Tax=Phragmites australis TaxID=29695 RepID=UPI002D795406|nr:phragmoplastin interacting protein 1-like [Phragmites australis]XP_062180196.1 phragmoplastin interacting protein 1-like [Phragmites australis]